MKTFSDFRLAEYEEKRERGEYYGKPDKELKEVIRLLGIDDISRVDRRRLSRRRDRLEGIKVRHSDRVMRRLKTAFNKLNNGGDYAE